MNDDICTSCEHVSYCMIERQPCSGDCMTCGKEYDASCWLDCASKRARDDYADVMIDRRDDERY